AAALPRSVKRVGVFVNRPRHEVAETAERAGLKRVQLSGDETVEDCKWLTMRGFKVIKVVRPKTMMDIQRLAAYKDHVFAFDIDTFKAGTFGGTGQVADWNLA